MRPSPILCRRLKSRVHFTTKDVARGFYRGTGTGALGAHTKYGNYLIDWRKVRHYVVPELKDFKLTPFVSGKIYEREDLPKDITGRRYNPKRIDGYQYLKWWMRTNSIEVDHVQKSEVPIVQQEQEDEPETRQQQQQQQQTTTTTTTTKQHRSNLAARAVLLGELC